MTGRRIVYVQFTNPAAYPPLEHSSRMLADDGCAVMFLGLSAGGSRSLALAEHPAIRVKLMPSLGQGVLQQFTYAGFVAWTVLACLAWRPHWVYASDPMSSLPALAIRLVTGCGIAYHEHDTPAYGARLSMLQRLLRAARGQIGRTAEICVLPQQQRLDAFIAETGRTQGRSFCVWNCPSRGEVAPPRIALHCAEQPLGLYFHGSINEVRLPGSVLEAMAEVSEAVTLTVVGYETIGSRGYMEAFLSKAAALGLAGRVRYLGPLAERRAILARAGEADVGLAFMPTGSRDINLRHMAGASNKPFDYLAVGTMPLVSDLAEWRELLVAPGYALACDPVDAGSLAAAFAWCAANRGTVCAMAEAGRRRIAAEWNYEQQFAGVARELGCPS